jgi:23S rRNA G2069 N7-methylase RlmK/C1962 C5-methylase RlmI
MQEPFLKEFGNLTGFVTFSSTKSLLSGCALIDPTIQPPIRIVSYDLVEMGDNYLRKCINDAYLYREKLSIERLLDIGPRASYRLVNEGGDGLPGITVDIYARYAILQTYSEYWVKYIRTISQAILDTGCCDGIYWKTKMRNINSTIKHYKGAKHPIDHLVEVVENGVKLYASVEDPASTGLFLDQRRNRQYVASLLTPVPTQHVELAKMPHLHDVPALFPTYPHKIPQAGIMLNTFAHTGAFSVTLASRGSKIGTTNIDISRRYLDTAQRNFANNQLNVKYHKFVAKDVFEELKRRATLTTKYDLVLLDPPSVARSHTYGLFTTKRRYRDLIDLSAPSVKIGGYIVAFVNTKNISDLQWYRELGVFEDPYLKKKLAAEQAEDTNSPSALQGKKPLKGFKVIDLLSQDVDFKYNAEDMFGRHLRGIVLQKINYASDVSEVHNQKKIYA